MRTNAGGDPMTVNAVNPRDTNRYGQIVRWRPAGGDHAANTFNWDLYVMAGNPTAWPKARRRGLPTSTRATCSTRPTGWSSTPPA